MDKILVVDDDQDLREQMEIFLKSKSFEVVTAGNEKEAFDLISSTSFDLAIIDLMMDHKDSGFIIGHKIKKKNKSIPVIMVSGVTKETGMHFDVESEEQASWMKVDSFIPKDVRFEQLAGEIKRLLGR